MGTLFTEIRLIDGTPSAPRRADVLVEGERIARVAAPGGVAPEGHRVVAVPGATLMPGLTEAHAHLSFGDFADPAALGNLPPEEHTLLTAKHARLYLERGFTSCVSGASAKARLDVVVRNAIEAGDLPGPRLLAAGPELTVTAGLGDIRRLHLYRENYAIVCDGPDQFRATARMLVREGVDTLKLNLSGDENAPASPAAATVMTPEEAGAVCDVARRHGRRVAAHARAAESVKMAARLGVDVIYHCSFCDEEALDLLEERRDSVFVAPTLGALHALLNDGARWGLPRDAASRARLQAELDAACESALALRGRGVRVLPGGDYGFAWNPHGTNARDLEHFVNLLGLSPLEAIETATHLGGQAMGRGGELGLVREGWLADLLLVDADPDADITVLQRPESLRMVMKGGVAYVDTVDPPRSRARPR